MSESQVDEKKARAERALSEIKKILERENVVLRIGQPPIQIFAAEDFQVVPNEPKS